jgi:Bacterial Ig-like domain (group 3)
MKLSSKAASCLLCALVCFSAAMASGQTRSKVYPPHAAGTTPPPVHTTHITDARPVVDPAGPTWTKATHTPPVSVGAMLLLTDGRVLVHSEPNCSGCTGNYSNWYTLTPDNTGSYVNGTWTQVASTPSGYAPLFFGSAVLKDAKVVIQGGEYNCNPSCSAVWQSKGAIYDPAANTWTATTPPTKSNVGDAQSVVFPDGTWMLAQCCAIAFGNSTAPVYYTFNESTLSLTTISNSTDGKFDDFDEEGWTLLPNGQVLTVDAYTSNTVKTGTNSELYTQSTNTWVTAGSTINQLWDSGCETLSGNSFEVGPAVLRPDGTVFATGASDCSAGHTAIYNTTTGTWAAGPDFASSQAANDAPAALETNGNVIVEVSPSAGTFSAPSKFYEWNGSTLTAINNPPNAVNTPSFDGHLINLPNGQIMYTDFSTDVEFLTPTGTFNSAWQPTITSVASTLTPGSTFTLSGTQLNGLSQASSYGDDFQNATNYPLVRITNTSTGHVVFAKTHDHSTMGIATGSTIVSTSFDVPSSIETGASTLVVIANGIPSAGIAVTVGSGGGKTQTTTALTSNPNPSNTGQTVTLTANVTPVNSPAPTGTVAFTSNGAAISGCTAVAVNASGVAVCTTSFATAATFSLVATYSGDSNYTGSTSNTVSQVVNGGTGTTSTKLLSSKNPSVVKKPVRFMATVNPKAATGTMQFTMNSKVVTNCTAVALASGQASCTINFPKTGTFSIVAIYSGDSTHKGSTSNTVSQVVNAQ